MEKEPVSIIKYKNTGTSTCPKYEHGCDYGELVAFGVSYEELLNGVGIYSTAIVKMADGSVRNVPVDDIKFLSP